MARINIMECLIFKTKVRQVSIMRDAKTFCVPNYGERFTSVNLDNFEKYKEIRELPQSDEKFPLGNINTRYVLFGRVIYRRL